MAIGRTNAGGGGSSLNFKVIAVSSELLLPATAKENTIAVITDTAITSYVFAPAEPETPTDGTVWFAMGTSSFTSFNAIKKNSLWVYPTNCKQYVSDAWVQKTAYTWMNEKWNVWKPPAKQLYWNGDKCVTVTGDWKSVSDGSGSISFGADSLYMYAPQGREHRVYTVNEIALAAENYSTLYIDCVVSLAGGNFLDVRNTSGASLGRVYVGTTSRDITQLDVSSIEKGIVSYACINTRTTTVYRIWAE
nr:MAG TPA: hypothetical protein [Caudoviricetes sp.]